MIKIKAILLYPKGGSWVVSSADLACQQLSPVMISLLSREPKAAD